MSGVKRARLTPSITNKADCGGVIKGGLAPSVGVGNTFTQRATNIRGTNKLTDVCFNCSGSSCPASYKNHGLNPASSGGVGRMFTTPFARGQSANGQS